MLVRAFGLACSLLVVDPLPAQVVFSPSEVQITSTAGLVNVTSASGTKVTNLQVPTASGEKPTSATHRPGAVIETGPDSQATVSISGAGSMLLGSDTQVRLPKAGDKGQSLELLKGKLFLNISAEEVKKQGKASFRLKTPAALLAVKGTQFFALAEGKVESCGVHEGAVAAYATASRSITPLDAGNAMSLTSGKAEAPRPLNAEERRHKIQYELAASEGRITNSLGMKFAPVPGTRVLFCIHETRYRDYAAYAAEVKLGTEKTGWKIQTYGGFTPDRAREDHPVTNITPGYAQEFCAWLSAKEGKTYRMPTDEEWSFAAGIGRRESRPAGTMAQELDGKIQDAFPWGGVWPPAYRVGNYCDESYHQALRPQDPYLQGYDDGFPTTAPVMSFLPNKLGLFDLGGNAWEWAYEDDAAAQNAATYPKVVMRGGSFLHSAQEMLLSSKRLPGSFGEPDKSFRVVMVLP